MLFIVVIAIATVVEIIKQYKKIWDEISQMFLLGSLSGIAVLGDTISEYLPVNLLMIFLVINAGVVLLRISIGENEYI